MRVGQVVWREHVASSSAPLGSSSFSCVDRCQPGGRGGFRRMGHGMELPFDQVACSSFNARICNGDHSFGSSSGRRSAMFCFSCFLKTPANFATMSGAAGLRSGVAGPRRVCLYFFMGGRFTAKGTYA